MLALRRPGLMLPAIVLILLNGCLARAVPVIQQTIDRDDLKRGVEAEPHRTDTSGNTRALLLGTGAIQLGPGLGKSAYRWLGDGQWGF